MKNLLLTIFLSSAACSAEEGKENVSEQAQQIEKGAVSLDGVRKSKRVPSPIDETDLRDVSELSFHLPSINVSGCSTSTQPSMCAWGKAADDIVLLEVEDVSFVLSPSVDSKTGDLVQTCDGALFPALKIEGRILESVNDNNGSIVINIGYEQYALWNVWPYLNGVRKLTWSNFDFKIGLGSRIGLVLHKNPASGVYSTLGEPFFQLNSTDTIAFSDFPSKCMSLQPENVEGLTFGGLKTQLQNCPPSAKIGERTLAKAAKWKKRKYADLGICTLR